MKKLIRMTAGEIDFYDNSTIHFASLEQLLMIISEQYDAKGLASFVRIKGVDDEGKIYSVGLDFSNFQMGDPDKANTISIEHIGQQKFLGELLLEAGVINTEQLTKALKSQGESNPKQKLGEVLISLGICKPEQIMDALSKQIGVPCKK
ncbi:MAG: hypothetical protein JW803_09530 [Endomicrobiales bacterium]|nr:hypothetical protein [Endomicrobiales bacterium]